MNRKSFKSRSFSRGWIAAVQDGKQRSSGIDERLEEFLEQEVVEETLGQNVDVEGRICEEIFQDRLRLSRQQEEARWRLRNPHTDVAVFRGEKSASSKFAQITQRTDTWQRKGRRLAFRVPEPLLGKYGGEPPRNPDGGENYEESGGSSSVGYSTPLRPQSASSRGAGTAPIGRPLSARSGMGGQCSRPPSAERSRALVFRLSSGPDGEREADGDDDDAEGEKGGESAWHGLKRPLSPLLPMRRDPSGRRTTVRATLAVGRDASAAERQLMLFQQGPSEKLKAQLDVVKGDVASLLEHARKKKCGLRELVLERAQNRRLLKSPSPEKVRRGEFSSKPRPDSAGSGGTSSPGGAGSSTGSPRSARLLGLRKTLMGGNKGRGDAPLVRERRVPDLANPNVGYGITQNES